MKIKKMCKKIVIIALILLSSFSLIACVKKDVELDNREFTISGESTVEASYSVQLEVSNTNDMDNIYWTSSDESIASVEEKTGIVSGIKAGSVIITCHVNSKEVSFNMTVTDLVVGITINGINELTVGDTYKFTYTLSKDCDVIGYWESSDTSIVSVNEEGMVSAISEGSATITYKMSIGESKGEYKLNVKNPKPTPSISISGNNKLIVGETLQLEYVITNDDNCTVTWSSSDESVLTVNNGLVSAIKEGVATITVSIDNYEVSTNIEITVEEALKVSIKGENQVSIGIVNEYTIVYNKSGYDLEFNWTNSNNTISQINADTKKCKLVGVKTGTTRISAKCLSDKDISLSIVVMIGEMKQAITYSEEEVKRAESILNNMTLEQKVGQMFIFSTGSETTFSSNTESYISKYHLGNVIYMGGNCKNTNTLAKMSNKYQEAFNKYNGISGFISIDQEGGTVSRITTGGTHFISEMGLSATNDSYNAYLEGKAMGAELSAFGVNMDFAPVMDVNNNPNNPIIGIRSYSDNPVRVSDFGDNMILGLSESNVIGCSKHFPGHGNTATDSHYGLPTITSSMDELYKVELVPFISAIANGINAIMTTHIIFNCIDTTYPATLSSKVLQGLLRDTLHYEGLIVTDGMEMGAIKSYFGTNDVTSVLAVKAGCDVLTYTGISGCVTGYTGVLNAVKNGDISEDRINQSVKRIILTKIKNGLVDNYKVSETYPTSLIQNNNELAYELAKKSITAVKGNLDIKKSERVLIVSTTCSYTIDSNLEEQSLACYAYNYLKKLGYNVSYKTVGSNNISDSDSSSILNSLSNYDKVIMAFSNVKTNNYTRTINFVNSVLSKKPYSIVIAMQTPYDGMVYNNMKNYICAYSYQGVTVKAITSALAKEYTLSGDLPIDKSLFK